MTILIPLVPLEVGTAELAVKMLTVSAGDILIQNVRVVVVILCNTESICIILCLFCSPRVLQGVIVMQRN